MSKKLFRPPPQAFESDEDEDDESDDELSDEDTGNKPASSKPPNNANLSSDDEDDDESDEEETSRKRKPPDGSSGSNKKRSKANSFFELEAEASDDDEDEEETGKDGEQMDEEAREIIRQQDRRRAQAGGDFDNRTAAEISRDIENRYGAQNRVVNPNRLAPMRRSGPPVGSRQAPQAQQSQSSAEEPVEHHRHHMHQQQTPEVYNAVAQQSLVPSVSDPSLWMINCLNGKEQELVCQIMNKCVSLARQGRAVGISAAIAAQSKGKIYIESFSEPAVQEAIQGVRGLMAYSMRLVPIGDMTTVMTVQSTKKPVQKNEWVRMTRGHYKGDLALVMDVKESGLKCVVQCVPRIDWALGDLPPEQARIRRKTVRPPQKFFNSQDVANMGKQSLSRTRFPSMNVFCDYFEGNYYHDGYLLKEMTVGSMIKPCTDDDPPTLDELQRFQRRQSKQNDDGDGAENVGSKIASSLLDELSELQGKTGLGKSASASAGLLIGDTVEVIEGDLVGLRGKLITMDGSTVKIKPNDATVDLGGTSEVEFLANQVRKYIAVGAHVKVTDGRYANETGTVVAVEQLDGETEYTAVIVADTTNAEMQVRTSMLRETAEMASGQDKLAGYELYDLVVLSGGGSANEVGVIVRVGREDFTVVNNHGIAREIRPEELRGKRNTTSQRAVALEAQGNQIRVGDTVNVAEGPHKGKSATIKRMSRAQLFLHSQTRAEHAGIFVVRSRSCVLAGSRSQRQNIPDATQSQSRGGPQAGRGKKDDGLIGKTVRIQSGQWKGYLGLVADATATHVQVELHSKLKKVMVVRDRVVVAGDRFGATAQADRAVDINPNPLAPTTPFVAAGQTPMHGGATPMHTGALESDEANDEVWQPGGAVDQEVVKDDDGWGSTNNDQAQGSPAAEDDGWGSTGGSAWGAVPKQEESTVKEEANFGNGNIKREQTKKEMETDAGDAEDAPVWFIERVYVQTKANEKKGVIKDIHANRATVEFEDGTTDTLRGSELAMVQPNEHDAVLVTGGQEIGLEGTLVCVDGSDAILKDPNDEFKIVDISFLARVKASA